MLIPVDKECKYSYYVLAESKRVQWDFSWAMPKLPHKWKVHDPFKKENTALVHSVLF